MAIYGTQKQHEKMPQLYRSTDNIARDMMNVQPQETKKDYEADPQRTKLVERILRDRAGL